MLLPFGTNRALPFSAMQLPFALKSGVKFGEAGQGAGTSAAQPLAAANANTNITPKRTVCKRLVFPCPALPWVSTFRDEIILSVARMKGLFRFRIFFAGVRPGFRGKRTVTAL